MSGLEPTLHPKAIPPFAALRAFEAFGRYGGVRKAAAALNLDHAAVSRHIRSLESWLGTCLIWRANGKVHLSDAGIAYHTRVAEALAILASATDELIQRETRRLRVWCAPGLANQWLAQRFEEF